MQYVLYKVSIMHVKGNYCTQSYSYGYHGYLQQGNVGMRDNAGQSPPLLDTLNTGSLHQLLHLP